MNGIIFNILKWCCKGSKKNYLKIVKQVKNLLQIIHTEMFPVKREYIESEPKYMGTRLKNSGGPWLAGAPSKIFALTTLARALFGS